MKIKLVVLTLGLVLFSQITSAQVPSYVPTNGLVGYWPFNGNANDESGNGNNGTNNGAILTTDRFGNNNSSYNFDYVSNNLIRVPNNSALNLSSNYTISVWFKSNPAPPIYNNYTFISKHDNNLSCCGTNTPYILGITWNANGHYQKPFLGYATNTNYSFAESSTLITVNIWQHLVIVSNNNLVSMYLDGIQIYNSNFSFSLGSPNNEDLLFGSTNRGPGLETMNGKLDDIGIWNRALTPEEIVGLYNAQAAGCETLVINSGPLSFNPPTYTSTVTIYPNPANDQITIDCGNLANVAGWSIKIVNAIGQEVFSGAMNTPQYVVPLNSWSGQGLYFVKIYDASNNLVNTKKIILQ